MDSSSASESFAVRELDLMDLGTANTSEADHDSADEASLQSSEGESVPDGVTIPEGVPIQLAASIPEGVTIPEGVPIQEGALCQMGSYKDKEELTDLTQDILAEWSNMA